MIQLLMHGIYEILKFIIYFSKKYKFPSNPSMYFFRNETKKKHIRKFVGY